MGIRLGKAMTILNVGKEIVVEYLKSKPGLEPTKELNPNSKLTDAQFEALTKEFAPDIRIKEKANTPTASTSTKSSQTRIPLTVSQRHWDKSANMPISIAVIRLEKWLLLVHLLPLQKLRTTYHGSETIIPC